MRQAATTFLLAVCVAASAADADKGYNTQKGVLTGLALSADGRLLAVASDVREKRMIDGKPTDVINGGELAVWDTRAAKKLCTVPLKFNLTRSMRFTPDGKHLAVAQRGAVLVLDPVTGKEQRSLKTALSDQVTLAGISPDGKTLTAVSNSLFEYKGAIQVFDIATGEVKLAANFKEAQLLSAVQSADGKRLFASRWNYEGRRPKSQELVVWELEGMKEVRVIEEKGVRAAAMAPDGKVIVAQVETRPGSSILRAYDAASGKETWKTRPTHVARILFPAEGKFFYTIQPLTRYEVGKDERLSTSMKSGVPGVLSELAISADGSTLAAGGGDANNEREVRVIRAPKAK